MQRKAKFKQMTQTLSAGVVVVLPTAPTGSLNCVLMMCVQCYLFSLRILASLEA